MYKILRHLKESILIVISFVILLSCLKKSEQKGKIENDIQFTQISDTIVGSKNVTNEVGGAAYLKKATEYFVVVKNDTSRFMPVFSESKENGKISINLNLPYSNKSEIYLQRIEELKLILRTASKEYNLDSLSSMSVGRLILTGDLAIDLTEQYKSKFGNNENITIADYRQISDFLFESKLAKDINELFEPYSISVEEIIIEKAFFTTKDNLIINSSLVNDTTDIPNKILDCITWIKFRND